MPLISFQRVALKIGLQPAPPLALTKLPKDEGMPFLLLVPPPPTVTLISVGPLTWMTSTTGVLACVLVKLKASQPAAPPPTASTRTRCSPLGRRKVELLLNNWNQSPSERNVKFCVVKINTDNV